MNIYILLIVAAILNVIISINREHKPINLLLLLIMCFVCACRADGIGSDTHTYLLFYESPDLMDDSGFKNEFVYYYMILLFNKWGFSPELCQVVMSLLFFLPLSYLIIKKSQRASVSILILFVTTNSYFFDAFNIQRQYVAISFLLVSFYCLYQNRFKYAIVPFIIACGFHLSTLTLLPLILLAYLPFNKRFCYIALVISLIWAFAISNISLLANIINMLGPILYYIQDGKYTYMTTYNLEESRTIFGLLSSLPPYTILAYLLIRERSDDFFVKLFFVGTVFLNIVSIFPISYRMALGLTSLEIFLYPVMFYKKRRTSTVLKEPKIQTYDSCNYVFMFYLFIIGFMKLYLKMNGDYFISNYLPYETLFN